LFFPTVAAAILEEFAKTSGKIFAKIEAQNRKSSGKIQAKTQQEVKTTPRGSRVRRLTGAYISQSPDPTGGRLGNPRCARY
jgi:hypothetical protein